MMKQKKISIKHLEKKSGLSKETLQEMFYENGVTKKEKAKKVDKKTAKFFLRNQQGLNQYGYSKYGFLDGVKLRRRSVFALGLLGLAGLFGLGAEVKSDMEYYASGAATQIETDAHSVASMGVFRGSEEKEVEDASGVVDFIDSMADVMEEVESDYSGPHLASPSVLPETGS